MTPQELQRLFEFTDDDLAANRSGHLSTRQQAHFRAQAGSAAADAATVISALPVAILLIALYFVLAITYGDALGPLVCVAIPAALGIFFAVMWLWGLAARRIIVHLMQSPGFEQGLRHRMPRVYGQPIVAIERGQVVAREGMLTRQSDGEHDYLLLNDEELQTSVDAESDERLWKLPTDRRYTFYTVPDTEWIVAVENLPAE